MAITLNQLKPGMRVRVRGCFGNDSAVIGLIEEISDDIKNGYPGICYSPEGKPWDTRWAYLDQIDQVLP